MGKSFKRRHALPFTGVIILILFSLLFSGCQAGTQPVVIVTPSPSITSTIEIYPTETPTSTSTSIPTPTATSAPVFTACSPLQNIGLDELHAITSNPFQFGSSFSDTGHPAVDLAFFKYKDFSTFLGHPVQALLPGRVVLVVHDRFPYGNMVLVETPLQNLSPQLLGSLFLPTPIPDENIALFSTCDKQMQPISWDASQKSLYTLYAHLEDQLPVEAGDQVSCGEQIGAVGLSGNTVAEHLHLEMRVGPANTKFSTIATYSDEASPEERYNYCIWSISGHFQAIDPSLFWRVTP